MNVYPAAKGPGRIFIGRDAPNLTDGDLRAIICRCLDKKLGKLMAYPCDGGVRVLVLENDEFWRGVKLDYRPFILEYLEQHSDRVCDEIWSIEGPTRERLLHWSSTLDTLNGPDPFRQDGRHSLSALYVRRQWCWQVSRLLHVEDTIERKEVVEVIQRFISEERFSPETEAIVGNAIDRLNK